MGPAESEPQAKIKNMNWAFVGYEVSLISFLFFFYFVCLFGVSCTWAGSNYQFLYLMFLFTSIFVMAEFYMHPC